MKTLNGIGVRFNPSFVVGVERGRGEGVKGMEPQLFFLPSPSPFFACHLHYKIIGCPLILSFSVMLVPSRAWARINVGLSIGTGVTSLLSFSFSVVIYLAYWAQKNLPPGPFFTQWVADFVRFVFKKSARHI